MLRINYTMKKKDKGLVFSIDAVFALYIAILLTTAFVAVMQTQTQTNEDLLKLSRLARDIYQMRQHSPGAGLPSEFSEGNNCNDAKTVGSSFIIVYNEDTNKVEAAYQKVCLSG